MTKCDVCRQEFTPTHDSERRCSELCRDIARENRTLPTKQLFGIWKKRTAIRPDGCQSTRKPRYATKREAVSIAQSASSSRFTGFDNWLRAYHCDGSDGNEPCYGWHVTSKPKLTS